MLTSARARVAFAATPSRLRFDDAGAPCCFISSAPRRLRVSLAVAGFGADVMDAACWGLAPRRGASGGAACSDTAAVDVAETAERSPRRRNSRSSSVAHLRCLPEWPTFFPEPGTHLGHSSIGGTRGKSGSTRLWGKRYNDENVFHQIRTK